MRANLLPRLMIILSILLLPLTLFWLLWPTQVEATNNISADGGCGITPSPTTRLVIYVLAFDNDPSLNNLTPKYTDTIISIEAATTINTGTTAIILADLDAVGDTRIIEVSNGISSIVSCLPDTSGNLQTSITEYDSADGATLGGFLHWVSDTYTTPASQTIFSYIGHGTFFAPETALPIADLITPPTGIHQVSNGSSKPTNLDVNADFTDHNTSEPTNSPLIMEHTPHSTSPSLITPYQLALALKEGTNDGLEPYAVVDLVHSFAATIEELYEISPYATTATGSEHYVFFDASLPGAALTALTGLLTPTQMATSIINSYHQAHPVAEHPRTFVAVDLTQVGLVKNAWDATAAELLNEFDANATQTVTLLRNAYLTGVSGTPYYLDTTFCPGQAGQWELDDPDQLFDFYGWTQAITAQDFSTATIDAATATADALDTVTIAHLSTDGVPWFAPGVSAWNFHPTTHTAGIAIFTPFETMRINAEDYHVWQAMWYTHAISYTVSPSVTVLNPHPFQFIQPDGNVTWADVLHRYWQEEGMMPKFDTPAAFCMPHLLEFIGVPTQVTFHSSRPRPATSVWIFLPSVAILFWFTVRQAYNQNRFTQ